jgi:hypothetical protein
VRWKAPRTSTYSIAAVFQDINPSNPGIADGATGSIVVSSGVSSSVAYTQTWVNGGPAVSTTIASRSLIAGDFVDFTVSADANYFSDSTRVSATITDLQAAASPWPGDMMQPGISVATCSAPTKVNGVNVPAAAQFVFGLLDLRNPPPAKYGVGGPPAPLWNPPMHHEASWTAQNLGMVFGTEIDGTGNIYLTAGGIYPSGWGNLYTAFRGYGALGGGATSLAAAGTIYKIDRITGVPTVFNSTPLPQQATNMGAGFTSGPGLGNIAYDKTNNQFFVTNMEDGKIYRLNAAGALVGTAFDPLTADNGAAGMPPLTERLWGICVYNRQVYYSVWNVGNVVSPSKIRRVNLDGTGAFLPLTDVEVLTVPGSSTMAYDWATVQLPTSDIEISQDGKKMMLAQRGLRDWGPDNGVASYIAATNHSGKVLQATLTGAVWSVVSGIQSGNSWGHGEGYGGVDWGMENGLQEEVVWCSSADLAHGPGPHGLQGTRPADFFPTFPFAKVPLYFKVPYDPAATTAGPDEKGIGGDVDIMQLDIPTPCIRIARQQMGCKDGKQRWTVTFENTSDFDISYAAIDGITGGVTGPTTLFPILPAVQLGEFKTMGFDFTVPAPAPGEFCFELLIHNADLSKCCSTKVCVKPELCLCIQREWFPISKPLGRQYCITLTNLSGQTATKAIFASQPVGSVCPIFTNPIMTFPPLLHGQSITLCTPIIAPSTCTNLQFAVSLHTATGAVCCSVQRSHQWGYGPDLKIDPVSDGGISAFSVDLARVKAADYSAIESMGCAIDGMASGEVVRDPWWRPQALILPTGAHRVAYVVKSAYGAEYYGREVDVMVAADGVVNPVVRPIPFQMESYVNPTTNSLLLWWDHPEAVMQTAVTLAGPWETVYGQPSPYVHSDLSEGRRFFRIIKP